MDASIAVGVDFNMDGGGGNEESDSEPSTRHFAPFSSLLFSATPLTAVAMSSSKLYQSACKAARSLLLSSATATAPRPSILADGRNAALASLTNLGRNTILPTAAYSYHRTAKASSHGHGWIAAIPAAVYMLQDQEAHAAQLERTFIAIKPDGVQRGLISEIVSRFERKGYKLVAIKLVLPSKQFAEKHYRDLKERPFFSGLCDGLGRRGCYQVREKTNWRYRPTEI